MNHHNYWYFVPRLIKIGPVVLEEKIFRSWQSVFTISKLLLLGGRAWSSFEQIKPEFPLLKDDLHQVWLKLAEWFWRRFSKVSMCFYYHVCHNNVPLGKCMALYLNKLESPIYPWMLCAKFGWNWPSRWIQTDRQNDRWSVKLTFKHTSVSNFLIKMILMILNPWFKLVYVKVNKRNLHWLWKRRQ